MPKLVKPGQGSIGAGKASFALTVRSLFCICCEVGSDILAHGVGEPAHLHADCHQIFHQHLDLVCNLLSHIRRTACHWYGPIAQALQKVPDLIHLHMVSTTDKCLNVIGYTDERNT